jgi:hypothetical protein
MRVCISCVYVCAGDAPAPRIRREGWRGRGPAPQMQPLEGGEERQGRRHGRGAVRANCVLAACRGPGGVGWGWGIFAQAGNADPETEAEAEAEVEAAIGVADPDRGPRDRDGGARSVGWWGGRVMGLLCGGSGPVRSRESRGVSLRLPDQSRGRGSKQPLGRPTRRPGDPPHRPPTALQGLYPTFVGPLPGPRREPRCVIESGEGWVGGWVHNRAPHIECREGRGAARQVPRRPHPQLRPAKIQLP